MALFDRPAVRAGAGAAFAGWGIVAVPVLLLWVATPYADGDLTAVPRLAAALWLLAHGGPVHWDAAAGHSTLGVAPLLVTAMAVGLVHHAAARTGRRGEVVVGYLGVALPAALLGLGSEPRTEPVPDLLWAALLALLAAMAGARRSTGEWGVAAAWRAVRARGEWLGVWPVPAPDGGLARRLERARRFAPQRDEALRAGLAGALALLGGGGAVLGVSILVHLGAAGTLAAQLAPDLAGRLSLMLLCVVLVPNAAIWSGSYALGTGFALGGHAAALGTQPLAPLALPLLADAPAPGRSAFGFVALAVPLLSGGVVGWALKRGAGPTVSAPQPGAADAGTQTDAEERPGVGDRTDAGAHADAGDFAQLGGREKPGNVAPLRGRAELALVMLAASACTGVIAGAGALWAGGTLGDGALAEVGPPVGWTALAAFGWTFSVALPTAFLIRWSGSRAKASKQEASRAQPSRAKAAEAEVRKAEVRRAMTSKAKASWMKPSWTNPPRMRALVARISQLKTRKCISPVGTDGAAPGGSVLAHLTDDVDWGFPAEAPHHSGHDLDPGPDAESAPDLDPAWDLDPAPDHGPRPDSDAGSGCRNPTPAAQ